MKITRKLGTDPKKWEFNKKTPPCAFDYIVSNPTWRCFYLIWFVLLMFGIYLRKKNIVKVPLWLEIFLFVLFVLIFVALYSYVLFIP